MREEKIIDPIEMVKYQLGITDHAYEDNIAKKSLKKKLALEDDGRQQFMYQAATICEQYLKGLEIWKGHTWSSLRKSGHALNDVFDKLDQEGRKILDSWYKMNPKKNPVNDIYSNMIDKSKIQKQNCLLLEKYSVTDSYKFSGILFPCSLEDGKYEEGQVPRSSITGINDPLTKLSLLLQDIKTPQYRYAETKFIFTDEEITLMFDFAKKLHALANMARGIEDRKVSKKTGSSR